MDARETSQLFAPLLHKPHFPNHVGDRFRFQGQNGLEFLRDHEEAPVARMREAEFLQAIQDVLDGAVAGGVGLGPLAARRFRRLLGLHLSTDKQLYHKGGMRFEFGQFGIDAVDILIGSFSDP